MVAVFAGCAAGAQISAIDMTPVVDLDHLILGAGTVGWAFYVDTPLTVQGLLFYNYCGANSVADPGDCSSAALQASHDVGIYDASQNLLAFETLSSSSPVTIGGLWQGGALASPLALTAGDTYFIMGTAAGDVVTVNPSAFSTIASITFSTNEANASGALSFPTSGNDPTLATAFGIQNVPGYFGPSFYASSSCSIEDDSVSHDAEGCGEDTPEPATLGLAGCCLAGILALRRILS